MYYEKCIVECSIVQWSQVLGRPDSFTVWRAGGGTLETGLPLCAVCFSLHLFCLHSTWITMHYPPVCTPAQVIREYMSRGEERRLVLLLRSLDLMRHYTELEQQAVACGNMYRKKGTKWKGWRHERGEGEMKVSRTTSDLTIAPSIIEEGWRGGTLIWGIKCFSFPAVQYMAQSYTILQPWECRYIGALHALHFFYVHLVCQSTMRWE